MWFTSPNSFEKDCGKRIKTVFIWLCNLVKMTLAFSFGVVNFTQALLKCISVGTLLYHGAVFLMWAGYHYSADNVQNWLMHYHPCSYVCYISGKHYYFVSIVSFGVVVLYWKCGISYTLLTGSVILTKTNIRQVAIKYDSKWMLML